MTRLAVINKEKCKPTHCNFECKKYCPIEKKETDSCITIDQKAHINEETCIGCKICVQRCPFDAIEIINLPGINEEELVHRYGPNTFALYGLPVPKPNSILGLLGRNGIGKTTAIQILSGQVQPNLGKDATQQDINNFFQGSELFTYLQEVKDKQIAYKPQNLSKLAINMKAHELLKQFADEKTIQQKAKTLQCEHLLTNNMNTLSGGELQKIAILAATLKNADTYFFDEPLAYLDIAQRLQISDYIKHTTKDKTTIVVEHDLLILDYLVDNLNIFFGQQGSFGVVSQIRNVSKGVNTYLSGFLKEENIRIRDKEITFHFTKNAQTQGNTIATWPTFTKTFNNFKLTVNSGTVHANNVVGILGKNGTGKSTFVKCLSGNEEVEIDGKTQKLELKLDISTKDQNLYTDEEALVQDIIRTEKINKQLIAKLKLNSLATKQINQLSGGELQRLEIARCLSKPADLYLIDEPSAYLDVEERIAVAKLIKETMVEKEKTAFVIDHDLLLISYLADSIINFEGDSGKTGHAQDSTDFTTGITNLLKFLNITLRKDPESGRPRINKEDSVLDREQKETGEWVKL